MSRTERQVAELGVFVHGMLAALHVLGIVYNLRRKNWWDVFAHGGAATYDAWAVTKHVKEIQDDKD